MPNPGARRVREADACLRCDIARADLLYPVSIVRYYRRPDDGRHAGHSFRATICRACIAELLRRPQGYRGRTATRLLVAAREARAARLENGAADGSTIGSTAAGRRVAEPA
jgi:hypothetical protein